MGDLTDKQVKEIGRIQKAGDFATFAEAHRSVVKTGTGVLLKEYGLEPLPANEV